jgi:hypothetical protein
MIIGSVITKIRAYVINQRTGAKIYSNTIQMKISIPETLSGAHIIEALNTLPANTINNLLKKPRNVIDDISEADIIATSGIQSFADAFQDEQENAESYVQWFERTRKGDSVGLQQAQEEVGGSLAIESVELISPGEIPLGFRLKSLGISIASALDQLTFITPNSPLPSDYFDVEYE